MKRKELDPEEEKKEEEKAKSLEKEKKRRLTTGMGKLKHTSLFKGNRREGFLVSIPGTRGPGEKHGIRSIRAVLSEVVLAPSDGSLEETLPVFESGVQSVVAIGLPEGVGAEETLRRVLEAESQARRTLLRQSRNLLRLLPVQRFCEASLHDIRDTARPLLERMLPESEEVPRTWGIMFKARNHTELSKEAVVEALAPMVPKHHKVHLSRGRDVTVFVELVKSACAILVTEDREAYSIESFFPGETIDRSKKK